MNHLSKYKFLVISVLISFISVASLLRPGLPPTHDGEYHVLRFQQFFKAINQGTLYPRWAEDFNNGYGIPLFNYVYPLPNYFASLMHLLGFSFIDSFKLNFIFAAIFGSVFFYLWSRKYWGDLGGVVSSAFYSFSPYHLLDVYVRGSVGEAWSLGIAPALFWSYLNFYETKKIKYFVLSSIFLSLLIFAHNILAMVFFAFFITYVAFLIFKKENRNKITDILEIIQISSLGIGLSAIFWLPAILETKYVRGLQVFDPTQHFPQIYKLIYSSWGYGFSGKGVSDQMSFQIGIANISIVFLCLIFFFLGKNRKLLGYFLINFFIVIFLVTPFSKFLWQNVPLMSFIQFPWRLLSILIFISSFLAGYLASNEFIKSINRRILISAALIIISFIFSFNYIRAPFHHLRNDNYYLSRRNFTDGTNSPGNVFNTYWFRDDLSKSKERIESENFNIRKISNRTTEEVVMIKGKKDDKIRINIAYFPGWTVFIDNHEKTFNVSKFGAIEVGAPAGEHILRVVLKSTKLQLLSLVITIVSALLLFGLFMWDKYIKIKK